MPAAQVSVQRGAAELRGLRGDRSRGEGLQGELGGPDVTAAVAPHVYDQAGWRQMLNQSDELGNECFGRVHVEGEDPQMAVAGGTDRHLAGAENPRHARLQLRVHAGGGHSLAQQVGSRDRGGKQQLAGALRLVQVEVQAERQPKRTRVRCQVAVLHRRRKVRCDQPGLPELTRHAVLLVADYHPVLVRVTVDPQRADGQRLHPAGVPGGVVAAGVARRVHLDGAGDRHPVPPGDQRTLAESAFRCARQYLRHEVARLIALKELLHQEWQEGDLPAVGVGQQVIGVQVPHRVKDLRHLCVEGCTGLAGPGGWLHSAGPAAAAAAGPG